jgi:hypothetical protein
VAINLFLLGVVVHAYNPSTPAAKAGGSRVRRQPGLHRKQSQKKKKKVAFPPPCGHLFDTASYVEKTFQLLLC